MSIIIAVDTGRRHTKFAGIKNGKPWSHYMFSITSPAHKDTFGTGAETARLNQTIAFEHSGKKVELFLSQLADTHGERAKDNRQVNWQAGVDYHALTYAAIGHALIECNAVASKGAVEKDITLILSLPVTQFYASTNGVYMRDMIAEMYSGSHQFSLRNRNFNINVDCTVLPQSYSTFIDSVCDYEGNDVNPSISNARVGIVDIGGETIDLSTIVEREVPKFAQRGGNIGVNRLIKRLENYVAENFNGYKFASPLEAERILTSKTPSFVYNGESHDLTLIIKDMRDQWVSEIMDFVKPQDEQDGWQPSVMSAIVFTGGASLQIDEKQLKEAFPHASFANNPSKSNVLGMLKFGIGLNMEADNQSDKQSDQTAHAKAA